MASEHIVRSYDEDLRELRSLVSQMGGLVETQLAGAVDALRARDIDMAMRIVSADQLIDNFEAQVEKLSIQVIALRAPIADDLREVVSALKISGILERMADYAKNIAKRVSAISSGPSLQTMAVLNQMSRSVLVMLKDVLDAYAARDIERARAVWERDQEVDDLYNSLFRSLLTYMMENPQHITPSTHLLFVAKNLERIGDQATNIAEIIHYNATGETLGVPRPKSDDTPFAIVQSE
jgi:phosphate transport system protein